MTKYFTKEYIREADCKEIQGLHKKFKAGEWACCELFKPSVWVINRNEKIAYKKHTLWLPTGDQLDEEIVKCLKEKELWRYEFAIENHFNWGASVTILRREKAPLGMGAVIDKTFTANSSNPPIAKIKLLKALLKENK